MKRNLNNIEVYKIIRMNQLDKIHLILKNGFIYQRDEDNSLGVNLSQSAITFPFVFICSCLFFPQKIIKCCAAGKCKYSTIVTFKCKIESLFIWKSIFLVPIKIHSRISSGAPCFQVFQSMFAQKRDDDHNDDDDGQ